jgi:hypothetical protein
MRMEAGTMEKKLILKMIQNCFKQYYSDADMLPLNNEDMNMLCDQILKIKSEEPGIDLYEVVNDRVYEFLTN